MALDGIDTIVFVMLENRSFDHALGYLSTGAAAPPLPVDGVRDDPAWLDAQANLHDGVPFRPHPIGPEVQDIADPPHDHAAMALQIGTPRGAGAGRSPQMGGFVSSYMRRERPPRDPSLVMAYYTPDAVPVFDFFARHYAVCDRWFAGLPTGTQANRLMAMAGESPILDNVGVFLPEQRLVYDWLTAHNVPWCTYQWGGFLPFFALMKKWLPEMTTSLTLSDAGGRGRFRRYGHFREHWLGTPGMPRVIFVEPEYSDGPQGPHSAPNDDHPPIGIAKGQALLADLYETLTANPRRWGGTMLVVTYDEHGGFFDHVPPLPIPADVGGQAVATTGVRVPAFVVSPHVTPGVPFSGALDHTSFLQLLADRFSPGQTYSSAVAARQSALSRLSEVLRESPAGPVEAPPLPPAASAVRAAAAALPPPSDTDRTAGAENTARAFHNVAMKVASDHPELLGTPGWGELAAYVAGTRRSG